MKAGKKGNNQTELTLVEPGRDLYFHVDGPGRFVLPAFSYWVRDLRAVFFEPLPKGGFPDHPVLIPSLEGKSWASQVMLDLREGKAVLEPGPPYTLGFDALVWGKKGDRIEISDVYLVSPSGLKFQASLYDSKGSSKIKAYLRAGKKNRFLANLEYG